MNLANKLTVARFFLTVLFVAAMSSEAAFCHTAALVLFIVASVTDYYDGAIARKYGLESDFGRLMDPLVDKILMAAAFIGLVPLGAIPAWVVIIIISREFLITGLRLLAVSKGKVLSAEKLGKHKTGWQITSVIFFLLMLSVREWVSVDGFTREFDLVWRWAGLFLIATALGLTLYSGFGYLWKHRALIETD